MMFRPPCPCSRSSGLSPISNALLQECRGPNPPGNTNPSSRSGSRKSTLISPWWRMNYARRPNAAGLRTTPGKARDPAGVKESREKKAGCSNFYRKKRVPPCPFFRQFFKKVRIHPGLLEIPYDIPEEDHIERFQGYPLAGSSHLFFQERPVVEIGKLHGPFRVRHHAQYFAAF